MSTAADIIKGALKDIGAIAAGETPSAGEIADGLESLNELMNSWSADGFVIFEEKREEFTLVGGTGQYAIGSGATFDTVRPLFVKGAGVKVSGNDAELPIEIVGLQKWQGIVVKTTQSEIPRALWYNPTYPNGEINLWPVPSAANTLILYSMKPVTTFALSTTDFSLPPGYFRALRKNLAVELSPEYGVAVSMSLQKQADDSYAAIARAGFKPVLMVSDAASLNKRHVYNYLTGE